MTEIIVARAIGPGTKSVPARVCGYLSALRRPKSAMYQTHAEQRKCDVPKCTDERGWHDLRHHEPRRDERSSRDHTDNQGRPKKLPRGHERGATGRAVKEPQSARRSRFQKMSPTNQTLSSTAAASIGYNGSPPAADLLKAAMQKGLVPVVADSATKARRELFVGNTPQGSIYCVL